MGDTFNWAGTGWHVLTGRRRPRPAAILSAEPGNAKPAVCPKPSHGMGPDQSSVAAGAVRSLDGTTCRVPDSSSRTWNSPAGLRCSTPPSALVAIRIPGIAPTGLIVGKRFIRPVSALPTPADAAGHVAQADARWRIYAFAGEADTGAPNRRHGGVFAPI